jgi:hypothetical protein
MKSSAHIPAALQAATNSTTAVTRVLPDVTVQFVDAQLPEAAALVSLTRMVGVAASSAVTNVIPVGVHVAAVLFPMNPTNQFVDRSWLVAG